MPTTSHLELLPSRLRARSLSDRDVVLPWPDIALAIDALSDAGIAVTDWAASLVYLDKRREPLDTTNLAKMPLLYRREDETWSAFVQRADHLAADSVEDAHTRWSRWPNVLGAVLHFALTTRDHD